MAEKLLDTYNRKRDFGITTEPPGKAGKSRAKDLRFVIQLHEATRTHYDFRLEWQGVMKSWAVTRGPSYDPEDKRLAVRTEDHPMDYNGFEGVIPEKQYGAGPVMIWDEGTWQPDHEPSAMEKKGHISFTIEGSRMHGHWHLIRLRGKEKRENWLLIKGKDDHVMSQAKSVSFLKKEITSIVSGRSMAEIRAAGLGKTVGKPVRKKAAKAAKRSDERKQPKTAVRAVKETASLGKPSRKARAGLASLQKKYASVELATLVDAPPAGADWVHEIKYDGYRLMAFIVDGAVILRTRGGHDWTDKFMPIAQACAGLKVSSAVIDLEACVVDANGRTDFSALKNALSDNRPDLIDGWVFDLIHLDGNDLRKHALLDRKKALAALLKPVRSRLHYSEHFESAPGLLGKACEIGAEGLISKRKDSHYEGRRSKAWIKSKCGLEQEFVIGGFMPAKDFPKAVGALLLGYYKDGKLVSAGKVGTGFTRKSAAEIFRQLSPHATDTSPFAGKLERGRRDYVYVKPSVLAQVSFLEWTPDGHIRHASFKGLREDKNAKAVVEEIPEHIEDLENSTAKRSSSPNSKAKARPAKSRASGAKPTVKKSKPADALIVEGVSITHPDREVFPGTGITKGEIAEYYAKVAPLMLPFMEKRLISLLRCTDGIEGQCFFQRNPMKGMGDEIYPRPVKHDGKDYEYIYIKNKTGLLQLAQMGTIEFHAWQDRLDSKQRPDQIIFDLDPDEGVPFEAVKLGALDIRARLKKLGLESFARLSGGKGVHVVVPIRPDHDWDSVKSFAREFSEQVVADAPDAYVANMSKKKRVGKIFIDFFRNDFSATAIVPFSLRGRAGAALAWPVSWADLKKADAASAVHICDVTPALLRKAKKICDEYMASSQRLKL